MVFKIKNTDRDASSFQGTIIISSPRIEEVIQSESDEKPWRNDVVESEML